MHLHRQRWLGKFWKPSRKLRSHTGFALRLRVPKRSDFLWTRSHNDAGWKESPHPYSRGRLSSQSLRKLIRDHWHRTCSIYKYDRIRRTDRKTPCCTEGGRGCVMIARRVMDRFIPGCFRMEHRFSCVASAEARPLQVRSSQHPPRWDLASQNYALAFSW